MLFWLIGCIVLLLAVALMFKWYREKGAAVNIEKNEMTQLRSLTQRLDVIAKDLASSAQTIRQSTLPPRGHEHD